MTELTIVRREVAPVDLPTLHPLLQRIYAARGVQSVTELAHGLENLLPWHDLLGIRVAAEVLADSLAAQQKILIVGDFDADGATGTAVAVRALRSFGARQVDYLVPNRFAFGYGLTPGLVDVAIKTFQPDIIVTVDNGIANHAGVAAAIAAGVSVVVTDHHLAADTLPAASVIVNPNQPGDPFASKHIAGVGVIFYVMLALRSRLRELNWFAEHDIPEPNLSRLLDLVALGTVADVVALDHNNRILVQQGLRRIRAGQCAPGITALLEISQRNQADLQAADLAFAVAPRLNAAGRLDDMSLGIACLLTEDIEEARRMASTLNQLNEARRGIEQDMQRDAYAAIAAVQLDTPAHLPLGLCLFAEDWHQGVIGIVAGRIKDKWHRPVIAFALEKENDLQGKLKGSARSISGLHIRDVLADIAATHAGLIEKFGGHAMAAGLTLARGDFERFKAAFEKAVAARLSPDALQAILHSDGELAAEEHSLTVAEMLRAAGPWGQAFAEPLFDGEFTLLEQRIVGGRHLKLTLGKGELVLPAIAFNVDLQCWPNHRCQRVRAAYRMDVNEYRSRRSVQLIVAHLQVL